MSSWRGEIHKLKTRAFGQANVIAEGCLQMLGVSRPLVLLLLGHMRSGSSLMLHVLLTNPEVSAVGERNAVYARPRDLARLTMAIRIAQGSPFRHLRYAVDQVNHNRFTPNDALFHDPRIRALFILRQPQAAITSLLELSRVYYQSSWSVARAVEYYVERLARLRELGEIVGGKASAALIRYETLTQQPTELLEALRAFLGLQQGFSQTYQLHPFTGKRGDPGPTIACGRIMPDQATTGADLDPGQLEAVRTAYSRCNDALDRFALLQP